jgi:amino acid adenylation domain-containing protein
MLIADGASILMIFNQIMKHYENPELNVPEIKCTFRDYMLAYNDFKNSEIYKKDKEYWIKQLDSFPQAPVLPYKTDPSNVGEPHFDRCYKSFNREEWNQIKRKAQESSITPAAVLCTAYAQVLGYWSNQDRVAINSTVFNRYPFHEDVNRIIGDFTSVMLLGIDLKIGSTFWEKAKYVQDVFAEALEHRHYDGIEFIRDLTKYHNLGNKAVMPIVFTSMLFGNSVDVAESGTNAFGNVKMSVSQTSQVFIDQQIIEVDGGVTITWDYVEQLFDKEMMNNMFEQYIGILEEVSSRNENYCLTIKEKDQKLLDEYNSTSEAIPEKTLHGMFVEQAAENGESIAVIYEDETITYEELDKKSNQIAKYLNEQGVIRGDYVGVLAYRKIETIVNILGVLKAGAAYIPLNPDHPEERRNYILENASARMQLLPDTYVEKEISKYDIKKLKNNIYPDDIAYVIYTSGSTGKPKGVMVKHKAAANTIIDINNKFNVNEEDRIIGLSSMCFDLSVYDIFGALSSGAALVMINDQRDIKNINDVIKKHDISIWNSVPAIMDMLLDNIGIDYGTEVDYRQSSYGNEVAVDYSSYSDNDSLRLVLLSGDWIPLTLPEKIQNKFSNAEVISLGGATEASIWSIYYPVEEVQMDWKSIPYGIPLANQKFYVLNYNKDICPVEVIGELYIGGDGLAEGYMNDEEKTNNAFINHPDLGRLYNTGDYGVLHREGYIEFFGRKDQQIKIRGYRVELGEIQSGILEYKGIKNAVVVDKTHENGRKYLCAYIVGEKEVSITGVREYLEELLPDYMVPSYFVMVDEIPLTANGKVDRKALPEPDGNVELGTAYAAPTNEMENKLAVIWQSLLGLDQVGINDGFFELGGNSVMMVQMITKIDREIGVEINFREFLEKNTIAKLAGLISSRYTSNGSASSTVKIVYPEIVPDKEKMYEPFPLTGIQMAYLMGRDDKFELGGVSTHVYTEYETKLEEERFNNSINKIISRHPMMRAVILSNGQQKILDKVPEYKMEVVDLRQLDSKDQEKYILKERKQKSHHVFKTDEWPLFEFKMLKLTDETNYLFFGLDMLIADGASILMIIHEIMKYYDDPKLNLPEINCTFRDYMLAYNDFKNGEVYKKDREYWLQQLDSFPQAPVLPYKTDPSNIGQPHFDRCYKAFNSNQWNKIKGKVQENGITPAAALCTAYAEVLGYWSNQDRVAINSTIFNRYPFHGEVNSIIGDFTSVMLLGIDLKIGATFFEKAKYVQNVFAEALEHRHYDGVEFIGELSKYHNIGNKAAMPIVFTSMLFGNTVDIGESATNTFGDVKMSVSQTSQVFIDQQIIEVDGGISITWDYVEQLFEKDLIENMFEQYIGILESIIEEKEYRLEAKSSDLEVINEYNATEQEIGKETLHGLFIKQAEKTPNNIAVMFEENTLTYKELDEKSNKVANFLKEKNIGRNDYVGVIAERCIESIVNILGVLKAGAAYVPINPEHPEDRRKYILENSNCKMELLPDSYKKDNIASYSNERVYTKEYPEDMAYVIYTSGSTGKPKGVIITHKAAANTIIDINQKFDVNEEDKIIGLSSMCFDLSVYDIFGALSSGAALVMIEDQRDVKNIQKVIDNNGITIWNSVPAIMDMLIDNMSEDGDSDEVDYWNSHNSGNLVEYNANESLRVVLLSGDWIPLTLPEKIKDKFADAEVVSLGGATEASIWSIYYPIDEVNEEWNSIPYGMPLANQKFYVLNYEKEVCPIGIAGELYIGGEGLAEGYMNDEEKTNNAFINHPDLGRLYNTGDYGVMSREGYIEFLGRKDHQIKIRGYRVELGEIENRILEHQSIKNVVVIDRSHSNGRKYLCAYVVSDVDISVGELREHLGKTVPDYMIPSYFVILDKIPLTANGKVDRKALPEPEVDSLETGVEYVAPNSGIETKLAEIWQNLLNAEQVGINDNFFELGGNSVLLVKMHKQLEQEHPNKIKIVDVFSHPTIAKLAQLLEKIEEKKRDLPIYPLQMPVEFFTVDSGLEDQFYQLSIEGRLFEKLELISKNEHVSKYDILFALYSNLIAQITENNQIEIQTLFRENFVYSLGLSLEKVDDFSELLKIIKEKMSQIEPKRLFEVKDLNSYQGKKQAMSSALLLFYDNSLLTEQINLVDFYDLILEVEENESNMIISCSYNNFKINSKKVGELVSQYNQIIELLVENY